MKFALVTFAVLALTTVVAHAHQPSADAPDYYQDYTCTKLASAPTSLPATLELMSYESDTAPRFIHAESKLIPLKLVSAGTGALMIKTAQPSDLGDITLTISERSNTSASIYLGDLMNSKRIYSCVISQ